MRESPCFDQTPVTFGTQPTISTPNRHTDASSTKLRVQSPSTFRQSQVFAFSKKFSFTDHSVHKSYAGLTLARVFLMLVSTTQMIYLLHLSANLRHARILIVVLLRHYLKTIAPLPNHRIVDQSFTLHTPMRCTRCSSLQPYSHVVDSRRLTTLMTKTHFRYVHHLTHSTTNRDYFVNHSSSNTTEC